MARRCNVNGLELAIAEAGVGGHPLLLVHGFTGAKEDFTEWLAPLAGRGWHAVAPDLRGHGESDKPPTETAYSFDTFAQDLLGLADALGWGRFALLGHSMGGMVAQHVATRTPERLLALVLMDTGHGPVKDLDPSLVASTVEIVRSKGIGPIADFLQKNSPLDTPAHRRLMEERPGYATFMDAKLRASSPALFAAMALAIVGSKDRLGALRSLDCPFPSLVVVGEQDGPFRKPSEDLAEALGATLAVIPDAGHSPQFENPEMWWDAVSAFFAKVEPQ